MFDKLGNELKAIEKSFESTLPLQTPVIMRLDGKAFHTFTRGFEKPFSHCIHNAMVEAASVLCKEIQNARFAYTQSDEISILIFEAADKSQTWFGNRVQKMCSVAASICSNVFNKKLKEEVESYDAPAPQMAAFDVRVFSLPLDQQVQSYFQWRQEDAVRNSISMLAQAHFSHRKLHKKNRREMRSMLQSKGINWEDLRDWKKFGSVIVKQWREKEGPNGELVHRSFWGALENCPDFEKSEFVAENLKQEITCEV